LIFEENRGQAKASVRYLGRNESIVIAFTDEQVLLSGNAAEPLTLRFPGQTGRSRWEPLEPLSSASSYFIGNDPTKWVRSAPHSHRLIRRGIYPGIDLIFYGNNDRIEFDFILSAGADSNRIRITWTGADRQSLNPNGDLIVKAGTRTLVCGKPILFFAGSQSYFRIRLRDASRFRDVTG
jgi:hypothetical protein